MTRPTALVADDEPLLLQGLCNQLEALWPELQIVARAANGLEALRGMTTLKPDVAFLDIRMPGLSGLDVAGAAQATHVVFVSAFDEYAIDAFDKQAKDYLLKPVTRPRLQKTIARLQERLRSQRAAAGELSSLLQRLERERPLAIGERLKWIRAGLGNEVCLLPVAEVSYFQASEKYTSVVTASKEHLIRIPIKELMEQLDPDQFWQIHRATLVNVGHIECATRDLAGKVTLQLRSRTETLTVSRAFSALFRQM